MNLFLFSFCYSEDLNYYRPRYTLPILVRLFQFLMITQLQLYQMSNFQSGFRQGQSSNCTLKSNKWFYWGPRQQITVFSSFHWPNPGSWPSGSEKKRNIFGCLNIMLAGLKMIWVCENSEIFLSATYMQKCPVFPRVQIVLKSLIFILQIKNLYQRISNTNSHSYADGIVMYSTGSTSYCHHLSILI